MIERVDLPGERQELTIAPAQLVHGAFYDLATSGKSLKPGGIYRATAGNQQIVFDVDAGSKDGGGPIANRLLRFQPAN